MYHDNTYIVYVVKEVASFRGGAVNVAHNRTHA